MADESLTDPRMFRDHPAQRFFLTRVYTGIISAEIPENSPCVKTIFRVNKENQYSSLFSVSGSEGVILVTTGSGSQTPVIPSFVVLSFSDD